MDQLVVANWKMNPARVSEARKLCVETARAARGLKHTKVIVAAPAAYLAALAKAPGCRHVAFAAQDLSHEQSGSFTGEIGGSMLGSVGASHVIVGHSERRAMGEDDERISRKLLAAHKARLIPILCVGEHERDRQGAYLKIVGDQVAHALQYLTASHASATIIAYEPIWAIGAAAAGAAQPRDVEEVCLYIRRTVADRIGPRAAARMLILYGGSVEVGNAGSFMRETGIQGLLVGRASLRTSFARLLSAVDAAGAV